jgi:hypothetical protein
MSDPKNQTRQLKFRNSLRERGGLSTGVNLSPEANKAMMAAMAAEGASRSSIINKALMQYAPERQDEQVRPLEV